MRLAASILVLVLALGGAAALAAWGAHRAAGDDDVYRVEAIGPDGVVLDETVEVADATVLSALQAAAQARGVALDLVRYPGMGTYVRAIAGFEAHGASGWIYEVHREGAWHSGDRSSEAYALQKGDSVRWTWTGP